MRPAKELGMDTFWSTDSDSVGEKVWVAQVPSFTLAAPLIAASLDY